MCSIAGVIALKPQDPETILDYAQLLGLFLQHRGHEWVGVAHSNGDFLEVEKLQGLVSSLFGNSKLIGKMLDTKPQMMLMQTRFSTQGNSTKRNAQPHYLRPSTGIVALGSNGDIFDYPGARQTMQELDCQVISQNDAEILLQHILHHSEKSPETYDQGIRHLMDNLPASFSSWLATDDQAWLFRDPHGNRPFYWMIVGDCFIFASEDCALHGILNSRASQGHRDGLVDINQVLPGQIINIKLHSSITYPDGFPAKERLAHCAFCDVYFARPDSYIFGTPGEINNEQLCYQVLMEWNGDQPIMTIPDNLSSVVSFRYRQGKKLAMESPAQGAECVISVPASGDPAAQGFADANKLPFEIGLMRSQYVARTFISPGQGNRENLVTIKYQPVRDLFRKVKSIVLVDDSIVFGTTARRLVRTLRAAGAQEIHLRISCPPIVAACRYGVDMESKGELIAATRPVEEIADYLGVNSLAYLSLDGLKEVIGSNVDNFCLACWNKDFPIK
jgi:amidophosphoribosyltransferase